MSYVERVRFLYASILQEIDGEMLLPLCMQVLAHSYQGEKKNHCITSKRTVSLFLSVG